MSDDLPYEPDPATRAALEAAANNGERRTVPAVCVHEDGYEHPSDGTLPCPLRGAADNGEPELDDQVAIAGQYPPTGDTVWPPANNGEPDVAAMIDAERFRDRDTE